MGFFINPYSFGGATPDTTIDGKQVFLVLGDSKNAYSTDTDQVSPSPTAGTAYQWDNVSSVVALTSTDLINAGTAGTHRGSPYPQFCIDYNSLTGKKAVIVDGHVYGSFWSSATASLSWDIANSTIYPTAKTRANATLATLNLTKLKGIFITLGINDKGSATTIGTVTAAIQTLITQIATDFGSDIPIYISQMGTDNSAQTSRSGAIRNAISDAIINNAQVWEVENESALNSWGLMGADQIHYTQAGNNKVGSLRALFVNNAGVYSDKDVRKLVYAYPYDAINSAKKAAIATFIASRKAASNWTNHMDMMQVYVGDTENNILIDWVGRCSPLKPATPLTFNANANYAGNGVDKYLRTMYQPSLLVKNSSLDDIVCGLVVGTMTTVAGTAAAAFGTIGTQSILLAQDASNRTIFNVHQLTSQLYTTDTKLQSNTKYAIRRTSSTNMELLKNGSIVQTASVSSTGLNALLWVVGAKQNSNPDTPTSGSFYNGEFKVLWSAKASGFDVASFESDLATLLTALATP